MKRFLILCLVAVMLLCTFCSCGTYTKKDENAVQLSFKAASGYDYLKSISGQTVQISGYLASSSPADGSFIFLMNLPYQSCPFCVPNTSTLSNTIEVYPKDGEKFAYTTAAVRVTGKLEVAPSESENFTDAYGYEFNFKIVDAEYSVIRGEELSESVALWQKVAESGVVSDLYNMFDYLDFVCRWPNYSVNTYTDIDGTVHPGFFLYASDALKYLQKDGAQYNYGYVDGYFDGLKKSVNKIDGEKLASLVKIIEKAEAIATEAVTSLEKGEYTYEKQYVAKFETEDYIYTFPKGEELTSVYENLYTEFANWLAEWEM